jgi:ABC-type spermidine/putrescine transport system permease subunit II
MTTSTASRAARSAGFNVTGAALAILFLFPLVWSGWSSVKGQPGSAQPSGFGFGNYRYLASYGEGVATYLVNSTAVTAMTVAGTLLVSALGGYGFARFSFPGKNLLFLATLAILMVPYATILIPLYVLLDRLGLQNSLVGLSLVFIMFQLPFALFMMRNSFEAVPRELEEAALVDGCSTFTALRRVLLRAVRPGPRHRGAVRVPGLVERLLRAADPDQRRVQVHHAGGGVQHAAAQLRRDRLRRARSRRGGDGASLPAGVPAAATPLRARLHDRSAAWLSAATAPGDVRWCPARAGSARSALARCGSKPASGATASGSAAT